MHCIDCVENVRPIGRCYWHYSVTTVYLRACKCAGFARDRRLSTVAACWDISLTAFSIASSTLSTIYIYTSVKHVLSKYKISFECTYEGKSQLDAVFGNEVHESMFTLTVVIVMPVSRWTLSILPFVAVFSASLFHPCFLQNVILQFGHCCTLNGNSQLQLLLFHQMLWWLIVTLLLALFVLVFHSYHRSPEGL